MNECEEGSPEELAAFYSARIERLEERARTFQRMANEDLQKAKVFRRSLLKVRLTLLGKGDPVFENAPGQAR